jgi:REP element-mobilizing transposase RayT
MARPLRIEYPGAVYHVTVRGNERRDIFRDDEDRCELLGSLDYAVKTHGVKLYCYTLMSNHFHLLAETPKGDLGEFMGSAEREKPSLREIKKFKGMENILETIRKETGKGLEEIKADKSGLRQITMDVLCRVGGIKGTEIGEIFGVDYSTVSQGRRRLQERLGRDKELKGLSMRIERQLSK